MQIEFVPLLERQRNLYRIPRGGDRFSAYLRLMLNEAQNEVRFPPLVALNPMAGDDVAVLIDALIDLDTEEVATRAAVEASSQHTELVRCFSMGLVVADDVGGGWTNRYASEFFLITGRGRSSPFQQSWIAGVLWSSEPATVRGVWETVQTAVHRTASIHRNGAAQTLRDYLSQEGDAMARAGCVAPTIDAEDLEYTRQLLTPELDETNPRTIMECLFGDEASRTLGFTPRGLSYRAGLALALHDARLMSSRRSQRSREQRMQRSITDRSEQTDCMPQSFGSGR
ncbi:hypothetical protein SAMN05444166_1995 [Singulisphaera sp. GP187]|uniref:hypothetical protein n=1 Tax=Singulisphaera sp. GP187 TaxID=1882752 RepID=UPI00092B37F0|nr:hypothetical protein [Singulisphaera sp. GP187]SIO00380.1 hypothetical protein SAMN05444166_1995 [Singulisphaera sp. GP187]